MKKLSDMEFFKSRKVRIWSAVIAILLNIIIPKGQEKNA